MTLWLTQVEIRRWRWLCLGALCTMALALVLGWFGWREWRTYSTEEQHWLGQLSARQAEADAVTVAREAMDASLRQFRALQYTGWAQPEQRLEWLEMLRQVAQQQGLNPAFNIAPQRPLELTQAQVFDGYQFMASAMTLRFESLHDGIGLQRLRAIGLAARQPLLWRVCQLQRLDTPTLAGDLFDVQCLADWVSLGKAPPPPEG
jgi:hypothetical protein